MNSSNSSPRNVVITGIGVFSPLGIGVDEFRNAIANGTSGIAPVEQLAFTASPHNVAGEVRQFTDSTAKKQYLKSLRKSLKVMCREIQLGVASALQAVEDAGLDLESIDHGRFGVDFGANLMLSPPQVLKDAVYACTDEEKAFHFEQWGTTGLDAMEPLWLLKYLPNMPACHIGIAVDARGPNNSLTHDEASAGLAIGEALRVIQRGMADVMIAGSTGTRLHPVKTIHAALWDELAEFDGPPETWCRPFDAERRGQVVAEGSCSLLLEEESHARARGARIYGRLLGAGASCVVRRDGTTDPAHALVNAMQAALRRADLNAGDIGHVNAEGLGERQADKGEAAAIRTVFGDCDVPVTAIKSYTGNAGSGTGAIELAASILSLTAGTIPPTLNYTTPDPECPINVVHGAAQPADNKTVLKVNATRAGQASAVIVDCGV